MAVRLPVTSRPLRGWRHSLPTGRTLPAANLQRRHRRLQQGLWLHVLAVPLLSLAFGSGLLHAAAHGAPLAAFALLSSAGAGGRRQSAAVALGLLTASALVVHAAGGATEAHFHFFAIMTFLALYEDWLPFGLGIAFVFLHHLVLGLVAPQAVFGHGGDALGLAAVHAGYIAACAGANVLLWRANERSREGTEAALRRVELQYEVTRVLAAAVTLGDAVPQLLALMGGRLRFELGLFWTPDHDGRRMRPTETWTADERLEPVLAEFREGQHLALGEGVAGRAWETREVVTSEQLEEDMREDHRAFARTTSQRSGIALPVRSGRRVHGVLAYTCRETDRPDAETVALLEALSHQVAQFMDRLRRAAEADALHDAAMTDALTGLPNRRAWDKRLREHVARAARDGGPLALAVLDIDHFKAFNDSRGHQAGDVLLTAAAEEWRRTLRAQDVMARHGGEEFAVLMPGCDFGAAQEIAERLRARTPGGQTVSIGLASWRPGEDGRELMGRADEALYAAKAAGRDRVGLAAVPAAV